MKFEFRNKNMLIDFINMFLGIAIIVIAVSAFSSATFSLSKFPIIFFLGTILLILNTIKTFPKNKLLGVLFGTLSLVMAVALILSLIALL